jgi:hypothetical protein
MNPRRDRHGQVFRQPVSRSTPGDIQMTGRTTHDQIVVFQGPPRLAGQILDVQVREAHGLTIFADRVAEPMAALQPV